MSDPSTTTVHLLVSGRVQGVAYRASLREQALARGLRGWVRNLADGRVEAMVQGPQPAVDAVLAWCRRGPPAARVDAVQARAADPAPLPAFEQRRDG